MRCVNLIPAFWDRILGMIGGVLPLMPKVCRGTEQDRQSGRVVVRDDGAIIAPKGDVAGANGAGFCCSVRGKMSG
eukprot:scaffold958_cov128-Skeletonema_dohrnii-CCMP3373.AAC.15